MWYNAEQGQSVKSNEVYLMKTLSQEEQEIIKLIQEKKIVDIYSYLRYYNLGTEIQFQEKDILEAFENDFSDGDYNLIVRDSISGFGERPLNELKPNTATVFLNFDNSWMQEVESPANEIKYDYCLFTPIYICKDIDKILQFISIWQFLESEKFVIELPKPCEAQDMGLFLYKKEKNARTPGYKNIDIKSKTTPISPCEYMDWRLAINEHNLSLCMPYLKKQMQPTLSLDTFIETGFMTKEDLNERRNFRIALAGVLIAFIASLASLIVSIIGMSNRGYYKELQDINNSIQQIRDELHIDEAEKGLSH